MRDSIGGIRCSRAFSENLIGERHADCGRYPSPVDCVGGDLLWESISRTIISVEARPRVQTYVPAAKHAILHAASPSAH